MGTLTLGFILIALGCSFMLTKLNIIDSIVQVLSWWPIALILLGIEVLLGGFLFIDERCKLKFDGFSVVAILLTLFICTGSFLVSSLPIDRFNFNFPHSNIFYSDNSIFQKALTINASGKENLLVNNNLGSVQLQKASGDNIEIVASIKTSYNDYEYAKSSVEQLLQVTEGSTINIAANRGRFEQDKVNIQSIDYTIKVPEKLNVEVINKLGKVEASSIAGNLKINNTNGNINVKSVTGSLTIENRFGDIELKNATGLVDVKNENGAIIFSSDATLERDVKLEGKFGNVTLNLDKNQEGRFNLYTRHGNIKSSLPLNINKDNTSEIADSNIGNAKNQFNVKNENGTISINRN
jgi:hypothetical protein